jgi:hypothetical protein
MWQVDVTEKRRSLVLTGLLCGTALLGACAKPRLITPTVTRPAQIDTRVVPPRDHRSEQPARHRDGGE